MHEVGEGMDNCILWQRRRYDDQITRAGFVVILFVCCGSDLLVVCGADQVMLRIQMMVLLPFSLFLCLFVICGKGEVMIELQRLILLSLASLSSISIDGGASLCTIDYNKLNS